MRSLLRLWLVSAALLLALMAAAACGSKPAPTAPSQDLTPTQAAAPQATQPVAAPPTGAAPAQQDSQGPGPSLAKNPAAANTRHFQGDPNAPVVLIEVSDFQ